MDKLITLRPPERAGVARLGRGAVAVALDQPVLVARWRRDVALPGKHRALA